MMFHVQAASGDTCLSGLSAPEETAYRYEAKEGRSGVWSSPARVQPQTISPGSPQSLQTHAERTVLVMVRFVTPI